MAWNYDDAEIFGIIDSNIKDSPPNPPGINSAAILRSMLKSFWVATRGQVSDLLDIVEQSNSVTVATYEEAVEHFTGDYPRTIFVLSDAAYNDGEPSFYKYHPILGPALFGLDYNYTL